MIKVVHVEDIINLDNIKGTVEVGDHQTTFNHLNGKQYQCDSSIDINHRWMSVLGIFTTHGSFFMDQQQYPYYPSHVAIPNITTQQSDDVINTIEGFIGRSVVTEDVTDENLVYVNISFNDHAAVSVLAALMDYDFHKHSIPKVVQEADPKLQRTYLSTLVTNHKGKPIININPTLNAKVLDLIERTQQTNARMVDDIIYFD